MPTSPRRSRWTFPPVEAASAEGLIGVGADLEPETVLDAYARGIFPMPIPEEGLLGWWSPDPRCVLPLERFRRSRSLRRSARDVSTSINQAFEEVVAGCADPTRPHGWITAEMVGAYTQLHVRGAAHSIEVWDAQGVLVGGLYGVALGGLFAAESKFHRVTDASKVALARLVDELESAEGGSPTQFVLDLQWCTPHLASLGAVEISRSDYLRRLADALTRPAPAAFSS